MSQIDTVPEISAEQVDQADQSWDFLESHAIPGVMLCGLSIVHERDVKQKKKEKIVRANQRNRDITPSPTRVLPRTQASPSTLSSKSVLPSSIAEGEGGVPWRGRTGRGGSAGGT